MYAGTAVEFTVKYGNVSAPSAAPSSNSPDPHRAPTLCRFGCAILGLGQAADPPSANPLHDVDMSLLQRASVLQNAAMSGVACRAGPSGGGERVSGEAPTYLTRTFTEVARGVLYLHLR